jgi:membrane protease YdiL (CAAX protease family)
VAPLTRLADLPASHPLLGFLVAGFLLLVLGLIVLTIGRRRRAPLASAAGTGRALLYALVYGLCSACFLRVVNDALDGRVQSPWLFALGDVMFITLALFVWVMLLAEDRPPSALGFRGAPAGRMVLLSIMALGAVALYAPGPWRAILAGVVPITADSLVFATLFAAAASAFPEETLFRGYLIATLEGRATRWARVALPALAFTAIRALRFDPVNDTAAEWLVYLAGVVFPLGLWWGLMRDLAGGSLWPGLISHFLLEFGRTLERASTGLPA